VLHFAAGSKASVQRTGSRQPRVRAPHLTQWWERPRPPQPDGSVDWID
jgi:hypothetical protein